MTESKMIFLPLKHITILKEGDSTFYKGKNQEPVPHSRIIRA